MSIPVCVCVRACVCSAYKYVHEWYLIGKLEYRYVYKCATWAERGALVLNTKYPDVSVGKEGENVQL